MIHKALRPLKRLTAGVIMLVYVVKTIFKLSPYFWRMVVVWKFVPSEPDDIESFLKAHYPHVLARINLEVRAIRIKYSSWR